MSIIEFVNANRMRDTLYHCSKAIGHMQMQQVFRDEHMHAGTAQAMH